MRLSWTMPAFSSLYKLDPYPISNLHSCQLSRFWRDSPDILTSVLRVLFVVKLYNYPTFFLEAALPIAQCLTMCRNSMMWFCSSRMVVMVDDNQECGHVVYTSLDISHYSTKLRLEMGVANKSRRGLKNFS